MEDARASSRYDACVNALRHLLQARFLRADSWGECRRSIPHDASKPSDDHFYDVILRIRIKSPGRIPLEARPDSDVKSKRCDPERGTHYHGPGDTCECGARPNTGWADPTPFSKGTVRPEVPRRILGVDLEARPETEVIAEALADADELDPPVLRVQR